MAERTVENAAVPHCPACGRFSADCRYVPYLDEFGGTVSGTCAVHGRWSE